jgi:DNA polymerase-3 subunit epsilon
VARDLGRSGEFEISGLPLESADFVVVDLETTGLSATHAAILEIGAVRVSRLKVVDSFETLVRPAGVLPQSIVALTGIRDGDVAEAPAPHQALQAFRRWLKITPAAPFVAHNATFDHGFVSRAFAQWGFPAYRGPVLCTCKLARRLIPELGRYNLDHLCAHLGISNQARHRALGDAKATASALIDLLQRAGACFEVRTLGDLFDLQRRPPRRNKRRRG